jgi:GDP-L-fucose synthase
VKQTARIYVAGGDTLVGAALHQRLRETGYENLVGWGETGPDLTSSREVDEFFVAARPEFVFLVGGRSGGIRANQEYPAELMRDNLLVATHVLHAAYRHGASKVLYLASSCSYPRLAAQPMAVESLMTGPLEPTNEAYALAKLAGLKLAQAYRQQYGVRFITGIPANVFGPHDDFSPEDSHVIPGLIRRLHEAKQAGDPVVRIWGSGRARREFLYSLDLADACIFVMQRYDGAEPINLGGGVELSIKEVAEAIAEVVGYVGRLAFDTSRPDGMPRKVLDSGPLRRLGWSPSTAFLPALTATYSWFERYEAPEEQKNVCAAV